MGSGARAPRDHTQGGLSGDREPSGRGGCSHYGSSGERGWRPLPGGGGGGEKRGAEPLSQALVQGPRPPPAREGDVFLPATAAARLRTEQGSEGRGSRGHPHRVHLARTHQTLIMHTEAGVAMRNP